MAVSEAAAEREEVNEGTVVGRAQGSTEVVAVAVAGEREGKQEAAGETAIGELVAVEMMAAVETTEAAAVAVAVEMEAANADSVETAGTSPRTIR